MGKSKSPDPPDPYETANAQTGTNVSTALANAMLGNVNQKTPYGNLRFTQTGSYGFTDPNNPKVTYDIPTFTAKQTLNKAGKRVNRATQAAQIDLAELASDRSAFLKDYLAKPFSLDNEAVEGRLFELGRKRLDPVLAERSEGLRARLANQGIGMESAAYDRAMRGDIEGQNDAYNQLALTGRQQAVSELLQERAAPINEIVSLLSGSQLQNPSYVNANMPTVPTTDIAGLINENYRARLAGWQQQQAQRQGLLGGLFSLGSGIIASDARVKTDIVRIGEAPFGLGIYRFRYIWDDDTWHIGLLAQEVRCVRPDAVVNIGGIWHVDYGKVLH